MKIKVFLFIAITASGLAFPASAQRQSQDARIIAERNGIQKKFKAGKRLAIYYKYGPAVYKIRGIAKTNGIDSVLLYTQTGTFLRGIAVKDITAVRRVRTISRVIMAGGIIFFMGTAAETFKFTGAFQKADSDAIFGTSIVAIPMLAVAIPTSILLEKSGEKQIKKGWAFRIETVK